MVNFNSNICSRNIKELYPFYDYIEKNNDQEWHNHRMGNSIDYIYGFIKNIIKKKSECIILDVGDYEYVFTKALQDVLGCKILNTKGDLRYPNNVCENTNADIILLMEVIEHLPDIDNNNGEVFKYTGIKGMLRNIVNYASPDCLIFITTPNLCSYSSIHKLLIGEHPYNWQPHPRELTINELVKLFNEFNLSIINMSTYRSWAWYSDDILEEIKKIISKINKSSDKNREDNLFFLLKKK